MTNQYRSTRTVSLYDRKPLAEAISDHTLEWRNLLYSNQAPLHLAPEWVFATAASLGLDSSVDVFVGQSAGEVHSVVPLLRRTFRAYGMSFEAYESPGGNLVAYHSSFLTANSQVECLNAICRSLSDTTEILIIPAVVNSSDTEDAILDFCRNSNWKILRYDGTTSPYLTIGETWDNYLAGKSSNFRYTLRRKERGLAKKGDLSEKWFKTAECISELRETILLIESRSWKVSAHMAISDSPVERAYYDRLLPFLADNNALAANVLYVDRTPVAYSLCSVWNNRFAQLKTSFIEDFAALSPGLTANHHAIRHAFESGANEFDFLGDIMQHKTNWTDEVRRHTNYYLLAPSARASIVHCLKSVAQTVKGFRGRKPTIGRSGQTRR